MVKFSLALWSQLLLFTTLIVCNMNCTHVSTGSGCCNNSSSDRDCCSDNSCDIGCIRSSSSSHVKPLSATTGSTHRNMVPVLPDGAPKLVANAFEAFAGTLQTTPALHLAYSSYLREFRKQQNRQQDVQRLQQFRQSLQYISAHNSRPLCSQIATDSINESRSSSTSAELDARCVHYQLQLNHFADLLPGELSQFFTTSSAATANSSDVIEPIRPKQKDTIIMDSSIILNSLRVDHSMQQKRQKQKQSQQWRSKYINWASSDNPLGVSVISEVRNQGGCGACWAFVAAEAVEASLRIELTPRLANLTSSDIGATIASKSTAVATEAIVVTATAVASTGAVRPSLARIPQLSAQQLLDCDTEKNLGCNGGNPQLAFKYVKTHGLLAQQWYRFEGKLGECNENGSEQQKKADRYFIRKTESLLPMHEEVIAEALKRAPVAVGICGTDPTFLYYASGIYDNANCCTEQNHALLLVGLQQDAATGRDYWVAINSWGKRWGEEGFIRILKSDSSAAVTDDDTGVVLSAGICGLALTPSTVSGAFILSANGQLQNPERTVYRPLEVPLIRLYVWLQDNWQFAMLLVAGAMMLLSVILFTYGLYLDRIRLLHARARASQRGYSSIA